MKKIILSIIFIFILTGNLYAQKVTALTEDTSPTSDDLIMTVNSPASSPANRKVAIVDLMSGVNTTKKGWYKKASTPLDLHATTSTTQDDEVWSMVEFNGDLYVGYYTAFNQEACRVYKWDGKTLTLFKTFGTGVHFIVTELAVYKGKLYAATSGQSAGDGDIYAYDPIADTWTKSFEDTTHNGVFKMGNYNGRLYAGFAYGSGMGDVYSFDGSTWALSYDAPAGRNLVESMAEYNGKLFIGGGGGSAGTAYLMSFDGTTWTDVLDGATTTFRSIINLASYNGSLYASTQETVITGPEIIKYTSGTTWTDVKDNDNITFCHGLGVYNGRLYSGCTYPSAPGDVWVYDGNSGTSGWTKVFTHPGVATEAFRLFEYNGELLVGYGFNYFDSDIYAYSETIAELISRNNREVLEGFSLNSTDDRGGLNIDYKTVNIKSPGYSLNVGDGVGIGGINIRKPTNNTVGDLQYSAGDVPRWGIRLANIELGYQNYGSNLYYQAYTDAGTSIGVALTLGRADRSVGVGGVNAAYPRARLEVKGYATTALPTIRAIDQSENKIFNLLDNGRLSLGGMYSNYSLAFNATTARTIGVERHITTNTAGNNLTISAGGATADGAIATVSITAAGSGYPRNAICTVSSGTGGTVRIMDVDGSGGVTGIELNNPGSGYTAAAGTATSGCTGTGFTVNIATIRTSTDKNGGKLILESGVGTGTGSSSIEMYTHPAGSTGTTDTTRALAITIDSAGGLVVKKATADPCATMSEGAIFYNDTSNYMCYCTAASTDVKMSDDTTACF